MCVLGNQDYPERRAAAAASLTRPPPTTNAEPIVSGSLRQSRRPMNGGLLAQMPTPHKECLPSFTFSISLPSFPLHSWKSQDFQVLDTQESLFSLVLTHLSPTLFPSSPVMKMLGSRWNTTPPGCSRKKRRKWEVLDYWFSWQCECLSSGHHNRRPQTVDLNSRFIFSQFQGLQVPDQGVRVAYWWGLLTGPHVASPLGSHGERTLGCLFLLISPIRLGPTLMTSVNLNQGLNSKYSHGG